MELKEFITATLVDIQAGVQEAIKQVGAHDLNGVINPSWGHPTSRTPELLQNVQFDVAVTVSDKTEGNGEAGIKIAVVKIGGSVSGTAETSHVSRIQFAIPIIPPTTTVEPDSIPKSGGY